MSVVTEQLEINGEFSYCNFSLNVYSMIDHCMLDNSLCCSLREVSLIDNFDNFSDHRPLLVTLNINLNKTVEFNDSSFYRVNWNDTSKSVYYDCTGCCLYKVLQPECNVVGMCSDHIHCGMIDNYCEQIVNALSESAQQIKNNNYLHRNDTKFKWSQRLSLLKYTARITYSDWVNNGKPVNGSLYDAMIVARKDYKQEIKKAKQDQCNYRRQYVDGLLNSKDVNFWKKWKKYKCKQHVVNDKEETKTMANKLLHNFGNKYVNSADNKVMFDEFVNKYERAALGHSKDNDDNFKDFSVEEIEKCTNELKQNKAGDSNGLSVEHILFADPIIYHHLSILFALIMKHGHVPFEFKKGMIPVTKDSRKKYNDIDNYRPITIISLLSKIFEMCIFVRINGIIKLNGLQMGFVKGGGCEKCLYVVSNVVNYFLKKLSDVYIVTLDATAAFDRVNIYGLLGKLIDKNVPYEVVRVLLSCYTNSKACVRLNGYLTDYIVINSGVKQGGILSPLFYNIYVDDLMCMLRNANLGCSIGGKFFGAIFYADDIVLLGASVRKMRQMIKICCDYCNMHGICLNPSKTKWMCTNFYGSSRTVSFEVNGTIIENTEKNIKYLGVNLIMDKKQLTIDIDDRIRRFNIAAYDILLNSLELSEMVKCELIVKMCLPILTYGVGAVRIDKNATYRLHIAFRKIFRFIFKLPIWSHISELLSVFGVPVVCDVVNEKELNIMMQCLGSRFDELKYLVLINMYSF